MTPLISLVVPVLADTAAAVHLLASLQPDPRVEIIIVDGGADFDLDKQMAERSDVRLIRSNPGRAQQMNTGARAAGGEWLMFLHADSRLPSSWLVSFDAATPQAVGGWFRFALDDPAWQARLIERGVAWRIRLFTLPYGDQGLFVRRSTFEAMGGYRPYPLMEDVDFVRRLAQHGPLVEVPLPLWTSARRYRRDGWFRRSARNVGLISLYFCGVAPSRLARWYGRR